MKVLIINYSTREMWSHSLRGALRGMKSLNHVFWVLSISAI